VKTWDKNKCPKASTVEQIVTVNSVSLLFSFLKVSENNLRICEYYNVDGNRTQMTEEAHYVAIGKAVELTGLCPDTLRKLADSGKVKCYVTPSGQRRFDKQFLQEMCNSFNSLPSTETQKTSKVNFLYARVSSVKQKDDLLRQIEFLKNKKPEYATYVSISDIGSGINFKRKGLSTILDSCLQGTIGEVVVAHRDRLSRFAFDFINIIVTKAGGKIIVIDNDEHKTTEQELSEDILSIIHVFSCKQMGKRSYSSKNNSKVS
jgi:predicted site-specific integrase-resolvase